jgi:hypothetical protein
MIAVQGPEILLFYFLRQKQQISSAGMPIMLIFEERSNCYTSQQFNYFHLLE